MIAIIDYDAGNVKSVERAFLRLGEEVCLTRDPDRILEASRVVLPGVGNFGDAMLNLERCHLVEVIKEVVKRQTPFLGICVGMQLLFEGSEESPGVPGLGLFKGACHRFCEDVSFKVPQIGWNEIRPTPGAALFEGIAPGAHVYFVHSYYVKAEEADVVAAVSEYGTTFHASVQRGRIFATQFHPEKSGDVGLAILNNFLRLENGLC